MLRNQFGLNRQAVSYGVASTNAIKVFRNNFNICTKCVKKILKGLQTHEDVG